MPIRSFGAPLLLGLTVARSVLLGADHRATALMLRCIAYASLAFAVLGILQLAISPEYILFRHKTAYIGSLTGPFVNRNTAATYFGSCALLWSSIFFARIQHITHRLQLFSQREIVVAGGATLLNIFCVVLTRSRGGLLLTIFLLILLVCFTMLRDRRQPTLSRRSFTQIAFTTAGLVALLQILGGTVASRIGRHGLVDWNRWSAYRSAWRLAQAHFLFGVGWGNYETVFPSVRLPELGYSGVWDRAHSTILELIVETGAPFTLVTALLWAGCAVPLFQAVLREQRPFESAATHTALSVALLGVIHSSFDFSLQIPGYAVVFGCITGAGIGIALSSSSTHQSKVLLSRPA